jgi:hypothetical protein
VTLGLSGWFRSLPVDRGSRRTACLLGLAIVQFPLALVLLASVATGLAVGEDISIWRVTGSVAALVFPAMLFGVRPPAAASVGPFASRTGETWTERRFWSLLAWRAVGWRAFAALPGALLLQTAAWLYIRNNELTGEPAHAAARLMGICAVTVYLGALTDLLARRRPPWAWTRSLPRGAGDRVIRDSMTLGVPAAVIALSTLLVDRAAVLPVLAAVPPLAALAVVVLPRARQRITGASGPLWIVGLTLGIATAWHVTAAIGALATTPGLVRLAAWRDRSTSVTAWHELYHDAVGDSASWAAR